MATGILTSFWYYEQYDFGRVPESVPLVLDSGAFSAFTSGGKVDIDAYGRWVAGLGDRVKFAFSLDVLGDEVTSLRNWRHLLDECGVMTMPVIHYGTRPEKVLPAYLEAGADRLAFGGIAVSGAGAQVQAWCAYVFRWLRDNAPDVQVHGLGVHMRSRLAAMPWDSTDSSAFTGAWRFARLALWDHGHSRWHTVPLDGKALLRYGRAVRYYGVDPHFVAKAEPTSREQLVRLATRIEAQAAADWDARGRRRAERYLTTKPSVGEGYGIDLVAREVDRFVVDGSSEHITYAADEVARYLTLGRDVGTGMTNIGDELAKEGTP